MLSQKIRCIFKVNCSKKCLFNAVRYAETAATPSSVTEPVVERELIKGIDEPEYLDYLKPQVPFHGLLNINVKGYDYVVLDEYSKYIKNVCSRLHLKVTDSWPVPQKSYTIETLKPFSPAVESVYHLKEYERVVQIGQLTGIMAPILIEILQASKPIGVTFSIREHSPEDKEKIYIKDTKIEELEAELKQWKEA